MDSRGLLLIIASFLLCFQFNTIHAAYTLDAVVLKDNVQDGANQLLLLIQTTLNSDANAGDITLTSFTPQPLSGVPAYSVQSTKTSTCANSPSVCIEQWTVVFQLTDQSNGCNFGGHLLFEWVPAGSGAGSPQKDIQLLTRDLCEDDQYTLDANIMAMGPFADAALSMTKTPFYINDMVYFPYQVTYANLSVSKLTFNTIVVNDGTNNIKIYDGANLGAGNAVDLQVHPVTSTVGVGATASAWFSLKLSRQSDSPFASVGSPATTYTVYTTFDIVYKNAKRSSQAQVAQIHQAYSSFVVSNDKEVSQRRTVLEESTQEQLASAGSYVSFSMLALFAAALIGMML